MTGDDPETQPLLPAFPPQSSVETTAGRGDAPQTRPAESVPPTRRIGGYTIVKTLGRGGMGVVYLARDERNNREVALKVIPAGPDANPDDLARFRAEAEVVARLEHPNIVRVFEVGEGDKVAYLAMEYVSGGNLYKRVEGGRTLAPADAARLVEQIARGAHFAHERGIIHRDLKPSNILLEPRGPEARRKDWVGEAPVPTAPTEPAALVEQPKIADFGLAKQLNQTLGLTQSGMALGTPQYMAPEQAHGRSDQIGPGADIHALGAILYELLVGYPPFHGGSPLETMEQVVNKKPVAPSHMRTGIPAELEAICLKCLEKSPAKRYRTAAELADALAGFLAGPGDPTVS
ncbi:MAG TPA: serine/threonine-protein kinase, partial [Gemmataceae bacterium]|nr:serine/threonine-protein kinase [Gemmataceae bacterium]